MEPTATVIAFGPFRLLPGQRQLWKDEDLVELRPTSLAVLTYLAQQPERVVSAAELRKAVWGSIYVSRTAIRVCVREIRQALGDAALAAFIDAIGVVQCARTIPAQADEEFLLFEKDAPVVVDLGAIGLHGVDEALAGLVMLLGILDRALEKIQSHQHGLTTSATTSASATNPGRLRYRMRPHSDPSAAPRL